MKKCTQYTKCGNKEYGIHVCTCVYTCTCAAHTLSVPVHRYLNGRIHSCSMCTTHTCTMYVVYLSIYRPIVIFLKFKTLNMRVLKKTRSFKKRYIFSPPLPLLKSYPVSTCARLKAGYNILHCVRFLPRRHPTLLLVVVFLMRYRILNFDPFFVLCMYFFLCLMCFWSHDFF